VKARDVSAVRFSGRARKGLFGVVCLCLLALAPFAGIGASAAMAQEPPVVTVTGVSEVGVTAARLEGEVDPEGEAGSPPTYFHFEVSADNGAGEPDGNWMWVDGVPSGELTFDEISGGRAEESNPVPVEGAAENLQPDKSYYVRLVADNAEFANHVESSAPYQTFTTQEATAPALTAQPAGDVGYTLATLHGKINPKGGNVNPGSGPVPIYWQLEYTPKGEGAWNTAAEGWIEGAEAESSTAIEREAELAPGTLTPGREYEVRVFAYYLNFSREASSASSEFQTTDTVAPTATTPVVTSITASGAHFSSEVNPNAPKSAAELGGAGREEEDINAAYATAWRFQCEPGCGSPSGAPIPADNAAHSVEADPSGLEPHQTYHVRLVASNGGAQGESAVAEFQTEAVPPEVADAVLPGAGKTSIEIRAKVNPHNSPLTDCHFVWGTGGALDQTTPCESSPTGNSLATVAAALSNLEPGTEYSFRLLVATAAGSAETGVRHFVTSSGCPNESFRAAQHIQDTLPDCRAWEMVSPLEKGHGDIVGDGATTVAGIEGDGVVFNTRTPFGDTIGSAVSGQSTYLARRSPSGWRSHSITPRPNPEAMQVLFAPTRIQQFSDDLSRAIVWAYDLPDVSGDSPLRNNIYTEDTATSGLEPVTVSQVAQPTIQDFLGSQVWGFSTDARHIAFVAGVPFLPDAAVGRPNVYQWDNGVVSLAGVLPDGKVPPGGSNILSSPYSRAMSADGSRLVFSASWGGNQQLFMRIDGTRTVWVSETELDPSDPNYQPDPANVQLQAVTPDGRNVFFTTDTPLLPEDINGGTDLYRYRDSADPENDSNLTMISQDGAAGGSEIVGTSDDGERVYYKTNGNELIVWDHGSVRLITDAAQGGNNSSTSFGVKGWAPGQGRVTPDGEYVAFATSSATGSDRDMLGNVTNGQLELYLYSLADDRLTCVSCPSVGATSSITVSPAVTTGLPRVNDTGSRPRFLSDRGQVFFSTAEALVPQDTNGVLDAYAYDPTTGRVGLLSSGVEGTPATFADASASGNDVFFVTRQTLAAGDTDDLVDLYDARVGGGIDEAQVSPPVPCGAESCQGPVGGAPAAAQSVSGQTSRGNVNPRRHGCRKRRHARHRPQRCAHRRGKHHKRHVNADRRIAK
jgi:Tol biopolymer transport system component